MYKISNCISDKKYPEIGFDRHTTLTRRKKM